MTHEDLRVGELASTPAHLQPEVFALVDPYRVTNVRERNTRTGRALGHITCEVVAAVVVLAHEALVDDAVVDRAPRVHDPGCDPNAEPGSTTNGAACSRCRKLGGWRSCFRGAGLPLHAARSE